MATNCLKFSCQDDCFLTFFKDNVRKSIFHCFFIQFCISSLHAQNSEYIIYVMCFVCPLFVKHKTITRNIRDRNIFIPDKYKVKYPLIAVNLQLFITMDNIYFYIFILVYKFNVTMLN